MTVVVRPAMSDDDGTFTFGTALNKAFMDAVLDTIDDQTHSTVNPTVKPKTITDEVVTARGVEANLAAKLATLVSTNYLLGTSDLGTTWKVAGGRSLQFDDADVAHGMTAVASTSVWASIDEVTGTTGGVIFTGLSDIDQKGLQLYGINGGAAPANAALLIVGAKKSGTGAAALGGSEVVMEFCNYTTVMARFLGSGEFDPLFRVGLQNGTAASPQLGPAATPDVGLFFSSSIIGLAVTGHEVIRFSSNGGTVAYWEMSEHSDASAPSANAVRVYSRDSGAGKTQLVARFNTGAVQVIAAEP